MQLVLPQCLHPDAVCAARQTGGQLPQLRLADAQEPVHAALICTIHLKGAPKVPNLTLCRSSQVVKCRSCGRSTHKQEYTQWFHNVTAAALREHAAAQPHATLGDRMKAINAAIRKTCNRDEGASP